MWKDLSGNDNDGELTNVDYTTTSGWVDKKIVLSGNEEITLPIKLPKAGTFSVEIVFTENNYTKNGLLAADNGWSGFKAHIWDDNGSIYIGGNANVDMVNNRFTPTDILYKTQIGKTDYICYTYNGETKEATFYANGVKISQKTFNADPKEIAYFAIYNAQKDYSRVSFYDKVLSQEEIEHNYAIDKYRFDISE